MNDVATILTPVGRLIQGSLDTPNTTNQAGEPLVYKTGPSAGQPRSDYFFAIAVQKTEPGLQEIFDTLQRVAKEGFPQGQSNRQDFSWKVVDGDTAIDQNGVPYREREGWAGCWIFKFSSSYQSAIYKLSNGNYLPITEPGHVKRGYYIRVQATVKPNGSHQSPGIYLNHQMVQFIAYGDEITSGPDAAGVFGAAPVDPTQYGYATPPTPRGAPGGHPQGQAPQGAAGAAGAPDGYPQGQAPQGAAGAAGAPGGYPQGQAPQGAAGAAGAPGGYPQGQAPQSPPPPYDGYMTPNNNR